MYCMPGVFPHRRAEKHQTEKIQYHAAAGAECALITGDRREIGRKIMEYRQLGASGVRVSAIGLGTNQFGGKVDQAGVDTIIAGSLDLGINFIGTADGYTH